MTAYDSILPTHALLARAAASPVAAGILPAVEPGILPGGSASRPSPAPASPLRKYVIVRDTTGAEHPILCPNSLTHRDLVPAGMHPVSAGFIYMLGSGQFKLGTIGSESLKLDPRPQDRRLISDFLS